MRNSFEFLSVSALDLFASALGVFILITFVLLPFYLKQPSLEADLRGEAVDIAAISNELDLYRERLITAQGARQDAEANLLAARQRLAAAQEATRQAAAEPKPAETPIPRKPGLLSIPALDLVIALDTTGSMRDELRDLQTSLLGIMRILYRLSPSLSIGVIAYKDYGQPYVTRRGRRRQSRGGRRRPGGGVRHALAGQRPKAHPGHRRCSGPSLRHTARLRSGRPVSIEGRKCGNDLHGHGRGRPPLLRAACRRRWRGFSQAQR
jgi:hypothetical protein